MIRRVNLQEFQQISEQVPIIDVRSEKEFLKGHFPGSISFPILQNDEREKVGTAYKQKGRETAVILGFALVGPKFSKYLQLALEKFSEKKVALYCWRGGMRSNIMAWVLSLAGFKVFILEGGYKSFRKWAQTFFKHPFKFVVIGGKTGVGKTEVLNELSKAGEQIIDLEKLANHKGSAFGALDGSGQPAYEHFENLIAFELHKLDAARRIWVENESRHIGSVKIPDDIYSQIRSAPVVELETEESDRIERIKKDYCIFPKEVLKEATIKIQKRLGNKRLKEALDLLDAGEMEEWIRRMFQYYDDSYTYSRSLRKESKFYTVSHSASNPALTINAILQINPDGN